MGNLSTTIQVGKGRKTAKAEVSLVKLATAPRDAKHETRRVAVDALVERQKNKPEPEPEQETDVFGDPVDTSTHSSPPVESVATVDDPFADAASARGSLKERAEEHGTIEVPTTAVEERVEQGVHRDSDGEWVDLTKLLKDIDEDTKLEGMRLEATVSLSAVPREFVRDAFYVVPKNPSAHKFCALVWHGLRESGRVAVVRWTKKTGQYLGLVVARGGMTTISPHLVVVQLEWTQNIKGVPHGAALDMDLIPSHTAAENAAKAMANLSSRASIIYDMRDERAYQRAELLDAARAGKTWTRPKDEGDDDLEWLGTMLAAAAS